MTRAQDKLLNVAEAAEVLRVAKSFVYNNADALGVRIVGGKMTFRLSELLEYRDASEVTINPGRGAKPAKGASEEAARQGDF